MTLAALQSPVVASRPAEQGGTVTHYVYTYNSTVTWVVLALALAWAAWLLAGAYLRARRLRRPPRRRDYGPLKRIVKLKDELSRTFLRPGFSANVHAVGVGLLGGYAGEYCIQVFVADANAEMWNGAGAEPLPDLYRGVPVILLEMPAAVFISDAAVSEASPRDGGGRGGIREPQEVIVGGLSGAHTNLFGQSGTIGYFCTRRSLLPRRKEIHLLSNSHVFADLRKASADAGDLIMHPSPGESAAGRPVAALVNFSALKFDGGVSEPNHVDAALAKLWEPQRHRPLIPFVGAVKGYVAKGQAEVGEHARKFGRTTGYTEGRVFSVHLDIWIRYDRTGQSAFFQNQILVEPSAPDFENFVAPGDSGSLLVDERQHALGLIFAGTSGAPRTPAPAAPNPGPAPAKRVEGYGVANPIAEVLDRLKIELVI
ncbi:MAG TPA: hypothetical protein VM936_22445 [Pyrinomonadaceae bacterium]|nr:hypothetical protein [Pyrinomonadaceae bacterium]